MFASLLRSGKMSFRRLLASILLEVFIIILGVLLSLWISNGFQHREEHRLEKEFLERLQQDLLTDQRGLERDRKQREGQVEAAQEVLRVLSHPPDTNHFSELARSTQQLIFSVSFSTTNPTFRSLESTGQLKLLRNDSLVDNLIRLYGNTYELLKQNNDDVSAFRNNFLLPYVVEEIDFRLAFNPLTLPQHPPLVRREQLFNMAAYLSLSIESTVEAYRICEQRVANLLEMVERELAG